MAQWAFSMVMVMMVSKRSMTRVDESNFVKVITD